MFNTNLFEERILPLTKRYGIPSWAVTIWREHEPIYTRVEGFRDAERTQPAERTDQYWLYSMTKLATCTAAMQLVERGQLTLDTHVADYLPAFATLKVMDGDRLRPSETPLTVLDLMTMRGGFDYAEVKLMPPPAPANANAAILDAIAKRPLRFEPGTRYLYSLCHDILAGVIAEASGVPYAEWLARELFAPLGMKETRFADDHRSLPRLCAQYSMDASGVPQPCGQDNGFVYAPGYTSGGAGLSSTLDDYILLLDALANGGEGRTGARILREATVMNMASNRLTDEQLTEFDKRRWGYGYGLGMRTRLQGKADNPLRVTEFGWDGAAGAYGLCDLTNHVALFYLQHVHCCAPAGEVIHPAMRDALYEALAR